METTALTRFFNEFMDAAVKAAPVLTKKGIFLVILFLTYKPVKNFFDRFVIKALFSKKFDELLVNFLQSFLNIIILIFYVLNVIQILGIETTSILTILGSIGLGVGLALKGGFADLAGGIQILISKYFVKGDYIVTCGVEGVVQKITFLYTLLYTTDNKSIIIPNGRLTNEVITNVSANKERRVDLVFSVAYDTSIEKVKAILNEIARQHEKILQDRDIFVRLEKHNSSSLDFKVRVWSKKEDYWTVYFDLMEQVKNRFDAEGIEIPYNKLDVYQR